MSFWQWLHALGPGWPTARGWYAAALFLQTCFILQLLVLYPQLGEDEFFKSIATAIVVTGWVGFAVAGRDNRIDREQVGEAQQLAREALAGWRAVQPEKAQSEKSQAGAAPEPLSTSGDVK